MYNHSPGDVHVKTCVGFFFGGGGGGELMETSSKYANENVLLAVVVISQQIDCNGVASSKHLSLLEWGHAIMFVFRKKGNGILRFLRETSGQALYTKKEEEIN